MCGIIGYLGEREAAPILIDGLRRLEYRGYDSAGVAVLERGSDITSISKSADKVAALVQAMGPAMPTGRLGIGHTRWATHGRPSVPNAHPHGDCAGRIFVVHNGIIENFVELRTELIAEGHQFVSETDSEVVPHLIEKYYRGDFLGAVRQAVARLRGAYALAMFSIDDPELLVGARLNAPLVVGLGDGEWFVASDITAIIPHTNKVLVLGEGEMAIVTPLGPTVTSLDGIPVEPRIIHVDWDVSQAERGGYAHFMLKEIHEAPEAVANALRGRLDKSGEVKLSEFAASDEALRQIREVRLLGMGTSLHAAMIGEYVIEDWVGIPSRAQDASEFRYRRPVLSPSSLAVIITQSGETADTLVAMQRAREQGTSALAITNVVASSAARDADGSIYLNAGPEIGVASTKTFVSHLISQYLLALRLAEARGTLATERRQEIASALHALPAQLREVLAQETEIARLAHIYARYRDFMFIGRGINHAVALEGALKLKEISYVHAEGLSGGELKHGPIALLDRNFPVVAICTESETKSKMISNVHEVLVRDAPVLALVSGDDDALSGVVGDVIRLPRAEPAASAVLVTVALQLFAYHIALELGRNVDQPRNLAKSVTVE